METPNQLLERLDTMGEQRVRALLGKDHFKAQMMPLVTDWLVRKAQEREAEARVPQARSEDAELKKALARVEAAREVASKATRLSYAAIAVASLGLLMSVLSLFAMALR